MNLGSAKMRQMILDTSINHRFSSLKSEWIVLIKSLTDPMLPQKAKVGEIEEPRRKKKGAK